jgi:hypothetical protein
MVAAGEAAIDDQASSRAHEQDGEFALYRFHSINVERDGRMIKEKRANPLGCFI